MGKLKIVVTDHRFGEIRHEEEVLRPLGAEVILCTCKTEDDVIEQVWDADGVLNSAVPIGRRVIEKMQKCKVIAYYGTGVDAIEVDAATERGIYVTNVRDYCSQEVAEHVMAFLLSLARKLPNFDSSVRAGRWKESLPQPIRSLKGLKLGLFGFGKIAQAVAEKAKGLGLEILVCSRREIAPSAQLRVVDFETLLRESDFLSLHTALTHQTHGRFGEREFRMMKPSAYFINAARGGLVDENALARALSEKWIAGAGLDVLKSEPPQPENDLLKLDSVILSPHVGWFSHDSNQRLRESAAREVLRVLKGEPPLSAVNFEEVAKTKSGGKPPVAAPPAQEAAWNGNELKGANGIGSGNGNGSKNGNGYHRKTIRTAEYIIRYLERMGVQYIFGVSGGTISPLYRAIADSGIRDVLTKHEGGASFMADGYARVSGRLGVCMATAGPGATNLITGVTSAHADSIPMLVLTGQVSTDYFGRGASQEGSPEAGDIVQMFKHVTRYSGLAFKAGKVPELLRKALTHALHGRKGPVHLSLPSDVLREEIDGIPELERRLPSASAGFDREAIRKAATAILRAKHPAMLIGHGCLLSDACEEARRLAEMFRIPVATTPKAKGALPEDHVLSMGCFGFSGTPLADEYLLSGKVDVLIAVGTSFNEWATQGWKKELAPTQALLQIDIDPREIGKNYPAAVPLVGEAKVILTELLYEIQRQRKWVVYEGNGHFEELTELRSRVGLMKRPERMKSDELPLKPQRLMADLRASLPADALVFVDGGANRSWATHYFSALAPHTFFSATGMASMGYGVAAAVGAKFAAPDRIVASIVGDGGFLMNGMEVATAVAYNKPVIWVVLNDGRYGMIYHGRQILGYPTVSSEYPMCDVAKVAEGLGARGIQIHEPGEICPSLIREIVESGTPTVLDVRIDPEEVPLIAERVSSLKRGFAERKEHAADRVHA
ncbi:MAG: hypothetical protein HYZ11_07110 [Candidatus Tectomicrobia bacterium]|uniref:Thiamine pyrophosphate-binding protein n=1 Tax=Tectimicrobiota bacterium TaxID=2528274 RepID=A0A932I0W5_UNCTE|nr:hypothetical protein [Candidatus Tectomicrobia bacterium]